MSHLKAFTLIELLIVVAIIAILAAIAVPNFLEAQTRSKVSRAKADMRSLRTAIEAYRTDYTMYPLDVPNDIEMQMWRQLTTPVAYATCIFVNPFIADNHATRGWHDNIYVYGAANQNWDGTYAKVYLPRWDEVGLYYWIQSCGPNLHSDLKDLPGWGSESSNYEFVQMDQGTGYLDLIYNPTNGTRSHGDLLCSNKRAYE